MKKDVRWLISGTNYVIRNVPYEIVNGEEFFDICTSITITALRDLMAKNKIPNDIKFEDFEDIEF